MLQLNQEKSGLRLQALIQAAAAGLLYTTVWGCLCSLGYLSTGGILPLLPGFLGLLLSAILPKRWRRWLIPGLLGLGLLLLLIRLRAVPGGCGIYLNRVFTASENAQSYRYEKFEVGQFSLQDTRYALLPLGLLSGTVFGLLAGKRLPGCLICGILLGWMAWLGLTPGTVWLLLLLLAAIFPFFRGAGGSKWLLGILAVLLACGSLLLIPGENAALSSWDEAMRDRIALHTVAYSADPQETEAPTETETAEQVARPDAQAEEPDRVLPMRQLRVLLVIVLALLLLFIPSILSDRLRKKREALRRGLEDADNTVCVRASFLYALRWLRMGGLELRNLPYSAYAGQIAEQFPSLQEAYARALPIWQRAAYSGQPCSDEERMHMQSFLQQAREAAAQKMNTRTRWKSRLML